LKQKREGAAGRLLADLVGGAVDLLHKEGHRSAFNSQQPHFKPGRPIKSAALRSSPAY